MTEKQALNRYMLVMFVLIAGLTGTNLALYFSGVLPEDLFTFVFLADVLALLVLSVVLYISIVKKRR